MEKFIEIQGAREHNLKGIDVKIPIGKITCLYGPSGSGKSSLAFHTLYAESKRRFLNSFPTYLKFFSERPAPVKVDHIAPVLPVFGLPQNNPIVGTRTCVADLMQVTDLLTNLFAHFAIEKCPHHNEELVVGSTGKFLESLEPDLSSDDIVHFLLTKDDFLEVLTGQALPSRSVKSKRSRKIVDFDKDHEFWEILRIKGKSIDLLDEKLSSYLEKHVPIFYTVVRKNGQSTIKDFHYRPVRSCPKCDYKAHPINKHMFNPHNPIGACSNCNGFGANLEIDREKIVDVNKSISQGGVKILETKRFEGLIDDLIKDAKKQKIAINTPIKNLGQEFWELFQNGGKDWVGLDRLVKYLERKKYKANVRIFLRSIQKERTCEVCGGSRVAPAAHNFCITREFFSFKEMSLMTIDQLYKKLCMTSELLIQEEKAFKLVKKVCDILETATAIGLDHLNLNRKAKSISAGEYQRLLLLKYLSYEGTGALFIFDEPSLGLSEDEIHQLFMGFKNLIYQGNTVLLVEHSSLIQSMSDYVIKMGPGPGYLGGEILYKGEYRKPDYKLKLPTEVIHGQKTIKVIKPSMYGSEFKDFSIEVGGFNWVHGRSGSGKSSSIINVLANKASYVSTGEYLKVEKGEFKKIEGNLKFDDVIVINANISRYTSRSSVGSATDLMAIVRKHFLSLSISKSMGLKDGHLSTNSPLGQCPKCEGKGFNVIEMQFLEDVILECEDCHGKGLKEIYANISDGNMTVYESYNMPLNEVIDKIRLTPKYQKIYEYMKVLNLSYLSLARSISSLSGGEKQRIYLLSKLQKKIENSLIILENISFGLSELELFNLAKFLQDLQVQGNNTIVVIDQSQLFKAFAGNEISFS